MSRAEAEWITRKAQARYRVAAGVPLGGDGGSRVPIVEPAVVVTDDVFAGGGRGWRSFARKTLTMARVAGWRTVITRASCDGVASYALRMFRPEDGQRLACVWAETGFLGALAYGPVMGSFTLTRARELIQSNAMIQAGQGD